MIQVGGYPHPSNLANIKTGYTFVNGTKKYLWKDNLAYTSYGSEIYTDFVGCIKNDSGYMVVLFYNGDTLCKYVTTKYSSQTGNFYVYPYKDYMVVVYLVNNTPAGTYTYKINGNSLIENNSPFPSGETMYGPIAFSSKGAYFDMNPTLYYSSFNTSTLTFNNRVAVSGINCSYNNDQIVKIFENGDIATFNYTTKVLKIIADGAIIKQYDVSSVFTESNLYGAILEGESLIVAINATQSKDYNLITGVTGPVQNVHFYNGETSSIIFHKCIFFNKIYKYRPYYQRGSSVNSDKSLNADKENTGYSVYICRNNNNDNCVYYNENESGTYKYTVDGKTFNTFTKLSDTYLWGRQQCYNTPTKGMLFYTAGSSYATSAHVSLDNGSTWTSITL